MGKVRIAATADGPGKGTKNMQARINRAARIKNKHLFSAEHPSTPPVRKSDVLRIAKQPHSASGNPTTKRRLSKAEKRRLKKQAQNVGAAVARGQPAHTLTPEEEIWKGHLTKFYSKHNPQKLEDPSFVASVLRRIGGKEAAFKKLFATLNAKYPVEETQPKVKTDLAAAPTPREVRAGDWVCLKCKAHNFAKRAKCVSCTTPRGDAVDLQADEAGNRKKKLDQESTADRNSKRTKATPVSEGPISGMDKVRRTEAEDAEAQLTKLDIKLGIGAVAMPGELLTMQYRGTLVEDGSEFGSGKMTCTLGAGNIIRGLDIGLAGMREGGTRAISIPSQLGYGDEGRPAGGIPGGASLLFVVNLLRVGRHKERGQRGGGMLPLPSEFLGKNRQKLLNEGTGAGARGKPKKRAVSRREKRRMAKKAEALAMKQFGSGAKAVSMKSARVRGESEDES